MHNAGGVIELVVVAWHDQARNTREDCRIRYARAGVMDDGVEHAQVGAVGHKSFHPNAAVNLLPWLSRSFGLTQRDDKMHPGKSARQSGYIFHKRLLRPQQMRPVGYQSQRRLGPRSGSTSAGGCSGASLERADHLERRRPVLRSNSSSRSPKPRIACGE